MRTLEDALKAGKAALQKNNIGEGDIDAWYLLSHCFQISRTRYLMNTSAPANEEQFDEYMKMIRARGEHIPLQHITGEQEFMGLNFHVSRDVLIPRQDTEILVEEILKVSQGKDVLDLCTGSGCIIISLAKLGGVRNAVGADTSKEAILMAERNAKELHVNVSFLQSDLYENIHGQFDIVVSNPPYIATSVIDGLMEEVKCHEPMIALDGKEDGLYFYRQIIGKLKSFLKPEGHVFFEIGYDQGEAVSAMLEEAGITEVKVIKDLAGLDRVVRGRFMKAAEPFT